MAQVRLSEVDVSSRIPDVLRDNEKTPWCKSVVSFTAAVLATPEAKPNAKLCKHAREALH